MVSHNKLEASGVPDGMDDLRELEEVDLSYNQLSSVPESLHYLKDRAHVLLQGNPLDEESLRAYHLHTWTPSKRFKACSLLSFPFLSSLPPILLLSVFASGVVRRDPRAKAHHGGRDVDPGLLPGLRKRRFLWAV